MRVATRTRIGYPRDHRSLPIAATNPTIAAETTLTARIVGRMHLQAGKVYLGYGDGGGNTGPTSIIAMDPTTLAFTTELASFGSHRIAPYKVVGDWLYALGMEPTNAGGATRHMYARTPAANPGVWTAVSNLAASYPLHVFDAVEYAGSLWLACSGSPTGTANQAFYGLLLQSTDDGVSWTEALRVAPVAGTLNPWFTRLGPLNVHNGKLYVYGLDSTSGAPSPTGVARPTADVYDGSVWTQEVLSLPSFQLNGPKFGPGRSFAAFGERWATQDGGFSDTGVVYSTAGPTVERRPSPRIAPYVTASDDNYFTAVQTVDSWLYARLINVAFVHPPVIVRSADGVRWQAVALAPSLSTSFVIVGNRIIYGGRDGRLYVADDLPV